MGILKERCWRCNRVVIPGMPCPCSTNHQLDNRRTFSSPRAASQQHKFDIMCGCQACEFEKEKIMREWKNGPKAAPILELQDDWAMTTLDFGRVQIERQIGGCRVTARMPDGEIRAEEFTTEEFYEFIYRRLNAAEDGSWLNWLIAALAMWIIIGTIAMVATGK